MNDDRKIIEFSTARKDIEKVRVKHKEKMKGKELSEYLRKVWGKNLTKPTESILKRDFRYIFTCKICRLPFEIDEEFAKLLINPDMPYRRIIFIHKNLEICLRNLGDCNDE